MDHLSAFMVGVICLLGFAVNIYSISYLRDYETFNLRTLGFFSNLFIAGMILVVTTANAFYFLIFWEVMTLTSYFLVIYNTKNNESIRAGYLYLFVAHTGTVLIMISFLILFMHVGNFDFSAFRLASYSLSTRNFIFLLAFFGFGAKAGIVPLHFWLPRAHPAAPSHISALMSGIMIETAIYGIIRVSIDFLGATELWWAFVILVFGALSAIFGAFFALSEKDLKRLLAYSSVENVGLILLGVGLGMVGLSQQRPVLTILGFVGALYHLLNHAFFKSLLFMGAGSIISQMGTHDLNKMGGLARRMPVTAFTFFIAALGVTAMPPLNGFISEWLLYQSFFNASQIQIFSVRAVAPLLAIIMAFSGAIAVMVYVKAYSSAFSGPFRNPKAVSAHEAPNAIIFSLSFLAAGCVILGLASPLLITPIATVAAEFTNVPPTTFTNGWSILLPTVGQASLSPPLIASLFLILLIVPFLIVLILGSRRTNKRSVKDPWSCGYGYAPPMSISAGSFFQPVMANFHPIYWLRSVTDQPFQIIRSFTVVLKSQILRAEPYVEIIITRPVTRLVETAGQWIQALQMGDIRVYCLYIIITLAILLIAIFGRSGL
jgi:hydrogenase-4 component B